MYSHVENNTSSRRLAQAHVWETGAADYANDENRSLVPFAQFAAKRFSAQYRGVFASSHPRAGIGLRRRCLETPGIVATSFDQCIDCRLWSERYACKDGGGFV